MSAEAKLHLELAKHQLCVAWEDEDETGITCMCGQDIPVEKERGEIDMDALAAHQTVELYDVILAFKAEALREAAQELAQLKYVKPSGHGREEYERLLAVRRGNTDTWLRELADELEKNPHHE
jgi:hypothetical protein